MAVVRVVYLEPNYKYTRPLFTDLMGHFSFSIFDGINTRLSIKGALVLGHIGTINKRRSSRIPASKKEKIIGYT